MDCAAYLVLSLRLLASRPCDGLHSLGLDQRSGPHMAQIATLLGFLPPLSCDAGGGGNHASYSQ